MRVYSVSRALEDLARQNVSVTVEEPCIRVIYRCRQSALPVVKNAIAILREYKDVAINLLRRETPGASSPEQNWPLESEEAQRKFGCFEARLYPFINRQVRTPLGTGKLLQVFRNRVTVLLDTETTKQEKDQKVNFFLPSDICALDLM